MQARLAEFQLSALEKKHPTSELSVPLMSRKQDELMFNEIFVKP